MAGFSFGTIGHTSMHHAVLGPWQGDADQSRAEIRLNAPLCNPGQRCARVVRTSDPDKLCGKCRKIMQGAEAPQHPVRIRQASRVSKEITSRDVWEPPGCEFVSLADLCLAEYQRGADGARARRMALNYNPRLMHPISVSNRDGKLWNYDGAHRAEMGLMLGWEKIAAEVTHGLTYEQEAALYAQLDDPRTNKGLSALQRFKAHLEAGAPAHAEIADAVAAAGYGHVGKVFACPDQLLHLHHMYGLDALRAGLGVCTLIPQGAENIWDKRQVPAWFITGIVVVLVKRPKVKPPELARVLGRKAFQIETLRNAQIRKHHDALTTAHLMIQAYNVKRTSGAVDELLAL